MKNINIINIIKEEIEKLNEVRYIQPDIDLKNNIPLLDNETIVVYHGFNKFNDALLSAKFGLSGKEIADRIYSYEYGNNPKGLFVTIDLNKAKEFANSGVIIEFSTKVSNLEAPVWAGGGSYFVQGQYTKSFKSDDERQQQQLLNREEHKSSKYPAISQSDRPELAYSLYQTFENQALFIGDLNPNMIKSFWINEKIKNERRLGGSWINYTRNEFLKKYSNELNLKSDKYSERKDKIFLPAEDFNIDKFKKYLSDNEYNYDDFVNYYIKDYDPTVINTLLYPRQVEQLKDYFNVE